MFKEVKLEPITEEEMPKTSHLSIFLLGDASKFFHLTFAQASFYLNHTNDNYLQ